MRLTRSRRPVEVRDIAGEALTLAGGGRALLLQIAHPAVGRGVAEHSDFSSRLLERFDRTMLYLTASLFGTPEQLAIMKRLVDRAHGPVRSPGSETAPPYDAFDPDLQLWVAATLYQTMMELHRRVFGDLTPEQADRAYAELSGALSNLQLTHDRWPPTLASFDAYWDDMLDRLTVDDDVIDVARQILFPRGVPWWLRSVLPGMRLLSAGLLPERVRSAFRIPWNGRRQRRFDRAFRIIGVVYPRLPLRLRHLPRDHYMAELRALTGRARVGG